jgi:hypothetical protein
MKLGLRGVIAKLTAGIALSAMVSIAYGQVYKCKDSTGKTLYSGQPCEYGTKTLPLSDNTVQGQRAPADAYGPSSNGGGTSGVSGECIQAQHEAREQTSKGAPRGIVEANRYRATAKQFSKQVEVACGATGSAEGQQTPAKPTRETGTVTNPSTGQPTIRCPDGSYVRGSWCQSCPDGSYVAGGSGCQMAPNGKYIQAGKTPTRCPDGSYVGGTCTIGPNGKYYGD